MSAGDVPTPDDPVEYYVETMRFDGKSERTIGKVERDAAYFEDYINSNDTQVDSFGDVTPRDVKKIKQKVENESNRSETEIKEGLSRVKRLYQYYSDRGTYDANPVKIAIDDISWDTSNNPSRRNISVTEMKNEINKIQHPLLLAVIVLFAKIGIRSGELVNLDLRDIHLDHPVAYRLLPEPREEIADRPDTVFIPSDVSRGDSYNGEYRTETNKRKRATKVPVDNELKQALVWWLLCRDYSVETSALFIRPNDKYMGCRFDQHSMKQFVIEWAKSVGWHQTGGDTNNNVSPHYFRHFFTTNMRQRLSNSDIDGNDPKLFIKGIRGDKGSDVISVYTHQWGNYVRETYNKTIYSLL